VPTSIAAQVLAKEYVRLGGRVIAVEDSTPSGALTAPTFTPIGGSYTSTQNVAITADDGTSIWYTVDGSRPDDTNGMLYTGPIAVTATTVTATTVINAIAYKAGRKTSSVASATYIITPPGTAAPPTFIPVAGTYTTARSVAISSATAGATIRYTDDGSIPSETGGIVYTGPITVDTTRTIQAIAYKTGMTDSVVSIAAYTIDARVAAPSLSPQPGSYSTAKTVTMSTTTDGATIWYTLDGNPPTANNKNVYSAPFSVAATTTVNAMAIKANMTNSLVTTGRYVISSGCTPAITASSSPSSLSYRGLSQRLGIGVTASGVWNAAADQSWVTLAYGTTHSGASRETLSVTVSANPGSSSRTATVSITDSAGCLALQVPVTQSAQTLVLSPDQTTMAAGQSQTFSLYNSGERINSLSSDWSSYTWTLRAGAGNTGATLSGQIYTAPDTITDYNAEDLITVTKSNPPLQATAIVSFSTPTVSLISFTPTNDHGVGALFTARVTNWHSTHRVHLIFGSSPVASTACSTAVLYPVPGQGWVYGDGSNVEGGSSTPLGENANGFTPTNNECTLHPATSRFTIDGDRPVDPVVATFDLSFKDHFAGPQTVFYDITDANGEGGNYSALTTYTVAPSYWVSPANPTVMQAHTQQFTAMGSDNTPLTADTWMLTPSTGAGTVDANGLYTAPALVTSTQTVTVTAGNVSTGKSASTTITLTPPPVTVSVAPASVGVGASQSVQFSATVSNTSNTAVTWSISPSVGTINSSTGLYTAPTSITAQAITVTATSQADTTKSATATINLSTLPVDLNLPSTTLTSGTASYRAVNSITAALGFVVSSAANVTFEAGNSIRLEPGFHATAGTATTTFHAYIDRSIH
jgi:hypothetical protein